MHASWKDSSIGVGEGSKDEHGMGDMLGGKQGDRLDDSKQVDSMQLSLHSLALPVSLAQGLVQLALVLALGLEQVLEQVQVGHS